MVQQDEDVPSKTDQLAVAIRNAIRQGELAAGELYSAHEIGERFGVSRTPVREALLRLADAGLVRIERNRGARIITASDADLAQMCTLRLLLEPPAARRAAGRMNDEERAMLEETLRQMREAGDDVELFFAADQRFHALILQGSGNERLSGYVASLRDAIALQGRRTLPNRRRPEQVIAEHESIARAIAAGAPAGAARAMHDHLLHTAELLLGHKDADAYLEWREWAAGAGCSDVQGRP